jgi:hypothetical protein
MPSDKLDNINVSRSAKTQKFTISFLLEKSNKNKKLSLSPPSIEARQSQLLSLSMLGI